MPLLPNARVSCVEVAVSRHAYTIGDDAFYTDVKRTRERSQTPNHGSAGTQGGGGAGGDGGAGGVGEQLAFLRNNPQFQGLRQVIRPMHLGPFTHESAQPHSENCIGT